MCLAGVVDVAAAGVPEEQAAKDFEAMVKTAAHLQRGYPEEQRLPSSALGALAPGASPMLPAASLDKTRMCRFFRKGLCRRGEACTFAHGQRQLRPQPDLWRTQWCMDFVAQGSCRFEDGCRYAHSDEELRAPQPRRGDASGRPTRASGLAAQAPVPVPEAARHSRARQVEGRRKGPGGSPTSPSGSEATTCSGTSSGAAGSDLGSPEEEPLVDFCVGVRNTFLELLPLAPAAARRTRSAPPKVCA